MKKSVLSFATVPLTEAIRSAGDKAKPSNAEPLLGKGSPATRPPKTAKPAKRVR